MRTTPLKVYIHLPKCGGTTVDANLNAHLGPRFLQYVNRNDWPLLQRHAATGFSDIDVITIHNARFPYARVFTGLDVDYVAVCREPVSAAVSMYNFATTATHTQNYERVKGLDFWQFMSLSHKIPIWSPNFQCYYLSGDRDWPTAEAFLDRYDVALYTLAELNDVYPMLSGQPLDPALDRNKSPKTVKTSDLTETDRAILDELFDLDAQLWARAQAAAAARAAPETRKAKTQEKTQAKTGAAPHKGKGKSKTATGAA